VRPVVLNDPKPTKIHDSLPLELFSPRHLKALCDRELMDEILAMLPWTFLMAALNLPDISTGGHVSMLGIRFWMLLFSHRLVENHQPNTLVRGLPNCQGTLCTYEHSRDRLNTVVFLIAVQTHSTRGVCLNRFGLNLLEHTFERTRIGYRRMNITKHSIKVIVLEQADTAAEQILELFARPKHSSSLGVDCFAYSAK
jgi:hypothetical protein